MKKAITAAIAASVLMIGCTNQSTEVKRLQAENDSLLQVNAQTTADFNEMIQLMNDVEEGFRQIKEAENYLVTQKDANGRHLLTPNPAEPKQLQLCVGPHVLPVKTYDNDVMPSTGTKIPMILGDLMEGIAYWDRRQFSIKVSDVATVGELNAFEQDLTIWRGSLRDDCTAWDDEAWVNGYIDTAAAAG